MSSDQTYSRIEKRAQELAGWLEQESPYVQFDQLHLDGGSPQQAYWHLGYLSALSDVLDLLRDGTAHTPGTSSSFPSDDPDV